MYTNVCKCFDLIDWRNYRRIKLWFFHLMYGLRLYSAVKEFTRFCDTKTYFPSSPKSITYINWLRKKGSSGNAVFLLIIQISQSHFILVKRFWDLSFSVLIPDAGEIGRKTLQIRTLLTKCISMVSNTNWLSPLSNCT